MQAFMDYCTNPKVLELAHQSQKQFFSLSVFQIKPSSKTYCLIVSCIVIFVLLFLNKHKPEPKHTN